MNHRPHCALAPLVRTAALSLMGSLTGAGAGAAPVHYFDGVVQRPITLETEWVAVITPAANAANAANAAGAQARSIGPTPLVTLRPASQATARAMQGQITPVYREGDSSAGRLMALPGGVVVKLNPAWTDAEVRAWAAGKGLPVIQRLNLSGNWYLLASAPGPASLELANGLHTSGEVLSAAPNWWKQTKPR